MFWKKKLDIKFEILPHAEKLTLDYPSYAKPGDAGLDLRAAFVEDSISIDPGNWAIVPTGVRMAIPEGFEGQVRSRSGLAANEGVFVLNSPGTVDSGYRGEIKVILFNLNFKPFVINRGDRIAQLVINKVERPNLIPSNELDETERGSGGLGSTGKQ